MNGSFIKCVSSIPKYLRFFLVIEKNELQYTYACIVGGIDVDLSPVQRCCDLLHHF